MIVTIADSLREEGINLGINQGARGRSIDILTRQLSRRFGTVSDSVREQLRGAEDAQLDAWLDRVLDAHSLDDVLLDPMPVQ